MIAVVLYSPHVCFTFLPSTWVYANKLGVIVFEDFSEFAILQSRIHEVWTRAFGATLKDDNAYSLTDCFETFPSPPGYKADPALEAVGQTYHDHRAAMMVAANEGMTKTYNYFHKVEERGEPIRRLRELHDDMDRAVLRAYGWRDLADELRPEFLTEETEDDHTYQGRYFWPAEARDRVLARLLALNAERHAEEVADGLAPAARAPVSDEGDDEIQRALDLD